MCRSPVSSPLHLSDARLVFRNYHKYHHHHHHHHNHHHRHHYCLHQGQNLHLWCLLVFLDPLHTHHVRFHFTAVSHLDKDIAINIAKITNYIAKNMARIANYIAINMAKITNYIAIIMIIRI